MLRSRGLGFVVTQRLASHGAKVYLAARSEAAARDAIARIEAEKPELEGKVVFFPLDLTLVKDAALAGQEFLKLESRLDILSQTFYAVVRRIAFADVPCSPQRCPVRNCSAATQLGLQFERIV